MNATAEKIGRYEVSIGQTAGERWYVHVKTNGRASWAKSGTFSTQDKAEAYVEAMRKQEAAKTEKRKAASDGLRKAKESFVNPFKVGDLLYNSWGYDQTNVDFAEVVAVGARSVTIREIAGNMVEGVGSMSGSVAPLKGNYTGEPKKINLTIRLYGGNLHASIPARYGSWSPCGEREKFYVSWYA